MSVVMNVSACAEPNWRVKKRGVMLLSVRVVDRA